MLCYMIALWFPRPLRCESSYFDVDVLATVCDHIDIFLTHSHMGVQEVCLAEDLRRRMPPCGKVHSAALSLISHGFC